MVVTARAKTLDSVRSKLLRKSYKRPRTQFTDRLGVRVIVYHAREVDAVAKLLRTRLQVRESDSLDKRLALGPREFGYRSYHIVGSLPSGVTAALQLRSLHKQIFEVQIRSLLEHVWAEIEHDVVYKSGANWPTLVRRRFASIAGVLELLEHEFDQLEETASRLIAQAHSALSQRMDVRRSLDVPTMCALLEILRPEGLSFQGCVFRRWRAVVPADAGPGFRLMPGRCDAVMDCRSERDRVKCFLLWKRSLIYCRRFCGGAWTRP
jgi:ppGpp synthetase/RelA/SpoT-type nucleotidyltranferase